MLKFKRFSHLPFKRLLSTSSNIFEHLKNRTLIRVSGSEVSDFLQGLITNDIGHLGSGPGSMYTMFLNNRGRVLYDAIIYRNSEKDTYLIECDNQGSDILQKHLKMYRVRRKIDVTNLEDELKIYVLFNHNIQDKVKDMESLDGTINPCQKLNESPPQITNKIHRDLLIYRDPRMSYLGSRIIAKTDVDVNNQINEIVKVDTTSNKNYRWLRYSLGVGEGVDDLPPGECFPLECNCDYLHGVSFHKGCYVGQELTARVYHTGVVRKRLMPIYFNKKPTKVPDEKIIHEKVNLGKFKGMEEDVALALLRIDKALAFKEFQLGDGTGYTFKPNWWPVEVSKEKVNVPKAQ